MDMMSVICSGLCTDYLQLAWCDFV